MEGIFLDMFIKNFKVYLASAILIPVDGGVYMME